MDHLGLTMTKKEDSIKGCGLQPLDIPICAAEARATWATRGTLTLTTTLALPVVLPVALPVATASPRLTNRRCTKNNSSKFSGNKDNIDQPSRKIYSSSSSRATNTFPTIRLHIRAPSKAARNHGSATDLAITARKHPRTRSPISSTSSTGSKSSNSLSSHRCFIRRSSSFLKNYNSNTLELRLSSPINDSVLPNSIGRVQLRSH